MELPTREWSFVDAHCKFGPLERPALIAVIEDALDQVTIMGNVLPVPETELKTDKTAEESSTSVLFHTDGEGTDIVSCSFEMDKLQKDRAILESILSKLLSEMKMRNTYKSLIEALRQESEQSVEEDGFLKEEDDTGTKVKELREQLAAEIGQGDDVIEQRNEMIAHIKDELQDARLHGGLEMRYIKKWEAARNKQHNYMLRTQEETTEENLAKLQNDLDSERRVNTEIEAYLRNAIAVLEDNVRTWLIKYDEDIEKKDREVNLMKATFQATQKKLEDLIQVYEEHKQAIEDYKNFREQKRLEKEYRDRMNDTALKIQSWWRGMMVRHYLGPYKNIKSMLKAKKGKKGKKK